MSTRVLAIWCMDWPAVAAAAAAGLPPTAPVAVTLANRVIACSASARAAGVRRGLRRRESQARCPQLHVVTADPARDARHFEDVTAAVDDLVPRAEVLRPGLLVLSVRGAARYFGSEQAAAERLVDAVAAAGAECQVGIADQLPTAVFAARAGRIVEPGEDALFLSALSIRQLATEPSLAAPGRDDLADLLWRMGIRNIGQFAALSRSDVASRFGADAVAAHRFARGEPTRGPSGREPPQELDAVMNCDPPIDRVDAAAFAGRSLARHPAPQPGGGRGRMHPAGHPRRHRQRRRAGTGLAMRRTADRGRHRRPGALAAGRLAEQAQSQRPADRPGHRAAAASGGSGFGRGAAAAVVGWHRRGGPAACPPRAGAGSGSARTRRRCRCRCSAVAAGRPNASPSPRWATSRCRGPIRASRGRVNCPSRRRRCCSTIRSSCSTPTAIRCG